MDERFTCIQCGKEVPVQGPGGKRSKFCSLTCQGLANRRGEQHPCPVCGNPVYSKQSKPKTFCSQSCAIKGRVQPPKRAPRTARPATFSCRTCGKEVDNHQPGAPRAGYCSVECAGAARRTIEDRPCDVCGKVFRPRAAEQRFCSRTCSFKGRTKRVFTTHARIHPAGYKMLWLPGHPRASDGYVMEHILVAEAKLGRPIARSEHVHHVNGDKLDNRPENLDVMTNSEHQKLHHALSRNHIT